MISPLPNLLRLLSATHFAEGLTNNQLQCLCRAASLHTFPANTCIFREGDLEDNVFIVSSGYVRLSMQVPNRGDVVLLTAGPGDLVGWSGLISDGRMTASAVTTEETTLVGLSGRRVRELCECDPLLGYLLMTRLARALSQRILATRLQLLDLFEQGRPTS